MIHHQRDPRDPGGVETDDSALALERIQEAARVVDPVFLHTPQFVEESLSRRIRARIVVKIEVLNPIRSFKGRGADYLLHRLGQDVRMLVAASAGNFGQGLAYAARRRAVPVILFASNYANPLKVERMRALGAEVRLGGEDFDAAKELARRYAERHGAVFVEDGAVPAIAEGAGTIAVELCGYPEPIDEVLVPVGNGALITGMGRWLKAASPQTRVVGVCAEGASAMQRSWSTGALVSTPDTNTIADGIAVRVPVPQALRDMRATVDDVLLVDDEALQQAMRILFDVLGIVVEPAGAAGLAACLVHSEQFRDKTMAIPLCGGNATREQIRRWLA